MFFFRMEVFVLIPLCIYLQPRAHHELSNTPVPSETDGLGWTLGQARAEVPSGWDGPSAQYTACCALGLQ